jgi:hypothetical protein
MNLERINHWLALAANLGVLIGVIFLAVEMRQNSAIRITHIGSVEKGPK